MARGAFLRCFLKEERGAALRTLFLHRLVPENCFALWIFRAAVKGLSPLGTLDYQFTLASGPRTSDAGCFALDVLALRIIRAGDEFTVTTVTLHQLGAVFGTFFVE